MLGVTRRLRVFVVAVSMLLIAVFPLNTMAATAAILTVAETPKVIVTEVQTGGTSAADEFIELYNTTDQTIDFSDAANGGKDIWKVQFFSAAAVSSGKTDWTKPAATTTLNGTVAPHDYYMLAASGYIPGGIDGDQSYAPRLSETGGGIQVVEVAGNSIVAHDRLTWQKPAAGQQLPAGAIATPDAGTSIQRQPDSADTYTQPDGSLAAWTVGSLTPKDQWRAPQPAPETGADDGASDSQPSAGETDPSPEDAGNVGLEAPALTEMLPNPASPLSDDKDEYIEVYNPNETAFNLKGYSLEVGLTTKHDFTFTSDTLIEPHGYAAFYSADTRLSLSNTGSQAAILDPAGVVLAQSAGYQAAPEGQSWIVDGSGWSWSTTPTPAAVNVLAVPAVGLKTSKTTSAGTQPKAVKTAAAKSLAAKKPAAAKAKGTTKTKSIKTAAAKTKKTAKTKLATVANTISAADRAPVHMAVLVAVAVLAVLYAAYEYRHDIRNCFLKFKRNRAVRPYAR